jgi:hypothetical protein
MDVVVMALRMDVVLGTKWSRIELRNGEMGPLFSMETRYLNLTVPLSVSFAGRNMSITGPMA